MLATFLLLIFLASLLGADVQRQRFTPASAAGSESDARPAVDTDVPSFLTGPAEGDPLDIALAYLRDHRADYGLGIEDLADILVTDRYLSRHTGVTHIYLRQRFRGIEVYGADSNVNVTADGRIVNIGVHFIGGLEEKIAPGQASLTAEQAVAAAAKELGLVIRSSLEPLSPPEGPSRRTVLGDGGISLEPIPSHLVYAWYGHSLRLAWNLQIYQTDAQHLWSVRVDARNGRTLGADDLVVHDNWSPSYFVNPGYSQVQLDQEADESARAVSALVSSSYRVYPIPVESPIHTAPAPPADARSNEIDPADSLASPFGWHDTNGVAGAEYATTQGNNVHAYTDHNNDNVADTGSSPSGGSNLVFDAGLDLTQGPLTYADAAVINLFYWNNILHDVSYRYGFDEAAGNFQAHNYTGDGAGNDYVLAEAQDSATNTPTLYNRNNANFATPPDGQNPRMQMYLWTPPAPDTDGDFDSGIIAHEYAHGISNRLVGGPSNVNCLSNLQQMGEGWSDWHALILTMQTGDTGAQGRGIGAYGLNQVADGPGIRPARYSTDMAVNSYTYGDLGGLVVPHGVGFLWATMLWEMNWALIGQHGFNPDIGDHWSTGGNNLAHQLVTDGMKLTLCSPGFVDGRDAILLADQLLTGGDNQCLIWEAFAKRGLGVSADQGSSATITDNTEAFDLPAACQEQLLIELITNPSSAVVAEPLSFKLRIRNTGPGQLTGVEATMAVPDGVSYVNNSATCAGSESAGQVTFPVGDLAPDATVNCSFQVTVDAPFGPETLFSDDGESGDGLWTKAAGSGTDFWSLGSTNPHSAGHAWFAPDLGGKSDFTLAQSDPVFLGSETQLTFWHDYNTEATWDGGVVEIKSGDGPWTDLGPFMIQNGYNQVITTNPESAISGRPAFSGDSGGYQKTVVDLSSFAGQGVRIRFRMVSDAFVSGAGWYVDDISISGRKPLLGSACVSADQSATVCDASTTAILPEGSEPPNTAVPWIYLPFVARE